jgi:hypothetical protein
LESVFDDAWNRGLPPETETTGGSREEFDAVREEGSERIGFYLESVAPHVNPHLVEHRFNFELDGVPAPVVGQVDLIEGDGTVVDHKTSLHTYPEDYLDNDIQLFCYAVGYAYFRLGVRTKKGVLPRATFVNEARVDVVVRQPSPRLQQIRKTYSDGDLSRIADILRAIASKIESREFPPFWEVEDRSEPWRTCDTCEHRDRCDQRLEEPTAD